MLFGRARSFAHKTFACCSTDRLIKHRKQMPYITYSKHVWHKCDNVCDHVCTHEPCLVPSGPSSVLPVFFPGGSVRFLKSTIFEKSSRQWVRVPGHDMGPGKKYHTKKGPDFFPESFLTYSDRKSISVCCDWGGVDLSVCVCKASGNQSWMTLIMGKFVEFLRLVARNLKVDGSNGSLLEHI